MNFVVSKTVVRIRIILRVNGAGGDDTEDNLIELCGVCHRRAHDGIISKQELREKVNCIIGPYSEYKNKTIAKRGPEFEKKLNNFIITFLYRTSHFLFDYLLSKSTNF